MSLPARDALHFPPASREFLEPALPLHSAWHNPYLPDDRSPFPFTTLTYAQSLDAAVALAPGAPNTPLSGAETKALTHYLRARHDGILIGVGTALADDPALNCRLEGVGGYGGRGLSMQPRPVIVDPRARWFEAAEQSKVVELARAGRGQAPWVVVTEMDDEVVIDRVMRLHRILERVGGRVLTVEPQTEAGNGGERRVLQWADALKRLKDEGLDSLMVEGGGTVIKDLLREENQGFVNLVVVTIAPVWLGKGGVDVSPARREGSTSGVGRLENARWQQFGDDVVLLGQFPRKNGISV